MLTDADIESARLPPGKSQLKLHDGNGLVLRIRPGGAQWVLRFRKPSGAETMLSLGGYPKLNLAAARIAANQQRVLLDAGHDPAALRKHERAASRPARPVKRAPAPAPGVTLGDLAKRWLDHQTASGHAKPATIRTHEGRVKLLKPLAGEPVGTLNAAMFAALWASIVAKGDRREFARRAASVCQQILRYGASVGVAGAAAASVECGVSTDSIPAPKVEHRPAVTEPAELAALLRGIRAYKGRSASGAMMVRDALLFSAFTAARPIEVRGMVWGEVDLDAALWTIPGARYKTGKPHCTPLSTQARQVLDGLHWLRLEEAKPSSLVFAWRDNERLSENALNTALVEISRGLNIGKHRSHGWRSSFKTICSLNLGADRDLVELCLGHSIAGAVERAYLRDDRDEWRIQERAALLQRWSDYLDAQSA